MNLIIPKEIAFKYNPASRRLNVIVDASFVFDYSRRTFLFDANPYNQEELLDICEPSWDNDFSSYFFKASFQGEEEEFKIISDSPLCSYFIKLLANGVEGFETSNNDCDKLELLFIENKLHRIYIYKWKNNKLLDSLTIINENGVLSLLVQSTHEKLAISLLKCTNSVIEIKTSDQEYTYHLEVQSSIINIVESLFNIVF